MLENTITFGKLTVTKRKSWFFSVVCFDWSSQYKAQVGEGRLARWFSKSMVICHIVNQGEFKQGGFGFHFKHTFNGKKNYLLNLYFGKYRTQLALSKEEFEQLRAFVLGSEVVELQAFVE